VLLNSSEDNKFLFALTEIEELKAELYSQVVTLVLCVPDLIFKPRVSD
jgi:hypothetical protein